MAMYPRGSTWNRWDLHVHTPESLVHRYGDSPDVWERFLSALESLPPEFKVIGINDYCFINGYRRVLEERQRGRLANIDVVLPVIELRLARFGGTKKLRRVNYHVLFSEELTPDLIESQFLNSLSSEYQLTTESGADWSGVVTHESLTDLGRQIIDSVPADKKRDYDDPIREGFNSLCLSPEKIRNALNKPYFRNKHLTGIGKTEWADLGWNDQSIAEKKTVINSADFVFVAAESPSHFRQSRDKLTEEAVNDKLLDASDAHAFDGEKDRIGNCFTWIKAAPGFRGLQFALKDYENRVFVGDLPPKLERVKQSPSAYIRQISVKKLPGSSLDEPWFDAEIPLNPGLVAIIGNKGSGKSALADIIALSGNSHRVDSFSFLQKDRFKRSSANKAKHFEASVTWCNGDLRTLSLDESPATDEPERISYLPQNYIEKLCNQILTDTGDFDREIDTVIFSHLDASARLGKSTLPDLIRYLNEERNERTARLRASLSTLNEKIAGLEDVTHPQYRKQLEQRLRQRQADLELAKSEMPAPVASPDAQAPQELELEALRQDLSPLLVEADRLKAEKDRLSQVEARTRKLGERLKFASEAVTRLADDINTEARALGLSSPLLSWNIDSETVDLSLEATRSSAKAITDELSEDGPGLGKQIADLREKIGIVEARLAEPLKARQTYLRALESWKIRIATIQGNKTDDGSVSNLQARIEAIEDDKLELDRRKDERRTLVREIFDDLKALLQKYQELYAPVQSFIEGSSPVASVVKLAFDTRIEQRGFANRFWPMINRRAAGSFSGKESGEEALSRLLSTGKFQTSDDALAFVEGIVSQLMHDSKKDSPRDIGDQLRNGVRVEDLFDYLYGLEYLHPRYALQLQGKELAQLSPGEKGLVLLVFYLLIDKAHHPLVVDQPEENLDNQTVYQVLVPCLRVARSSRQVILVTHNPNLAVAADADQAIYAAMDKTTVTVTYDAGALEDERFTGSSGHVVRVLEGTTPAFLARQGKYDLR